MDVRDSLPDSPQARLDNDEEEQRATEALEDDRLAQIYPPEDVWCIEECEDLRLLDEEFMAEQ